MDMYTKVDINKWKHDNIFDDVVKFFNRYSQNDDIAECKDTIIQHMEKYEEEIDAHIKEMGLVIDEKYDKLKKVVSQVNVLGHKCHLINIAKRE